MSMLAGTILLIKTKGFIPNQIRLHMAILAKRLKRDPLPWNHAEIVIRYKGELYAMGARGNGAGITPLVEYLDSHSDFLPLFPVVPLTETEIEKLEWYAEDTCFTNKRRYQYGMFLAWIAKLKLGVNWGEKGNKRLYCYEMVNDVNLLLNRGGFKDKLVSIYDLYDNKHYRKP